MDQRASSPVHPTVHVTDSFHDRQYTLAQRMTRVTFANCYEDGTRAEAYATLEFKNTYHLAYRDIPAILAAHVSGRKSLDFGCGTGRSTRFLSHLRFEVTGVDIAEDMIRKARQLHPSGDYRLISASDNPGDDTPIGDPPIDNPPIDNLRAFPPATYDLVLAAFTFDNIAGRDHKVRILRDLARLMNREGKLVLIVSRPEIYSHEWASFSTKDFPENHSAKSGDKVRIIVTDHADPRPVEDILWTDQAYREVFQEAHLAVLEKYEPLAREDEAYRWVSETQIAPWAVYVVAAL
jgi:ubiquinone/menaquinone biosynthesis C-methylase UbiE